MQKSEPVTQSRPGPAEAISYPCLRSLPDGTFAQALPSQCQKKSFPRPRGPARGRCDSRRQAASRSSSRDCCRAGRAATPDPRPGFRSSRAGAGWSCRRDRRLRPTCSLRCRPRCRRHRRPSRTPPSREARSPNAISWRPLEQRPYRMRHTRNRAPAPRPVKTGLRARHDRSIPVNSAASRALPSVQGRGAGRHDDVSVRRSGQRGERRVVRSLRAPIQCSLRLRRPGRLLLVERGRQARLSAR